MLALSSLREGFARGLVSLNTPPLLGRKSFEAKFCVSISSKLIETKRLQLHYFGHLRKTGGRGSDRLGHTAYLRLQKTSWNEVQSFPHACPERLSRGKRDTRGWGIFPGPTFKHHLKCRRADISSFSKLLPMFLRRSIPVTPFTGSLTQKQGVPGVGHTKFLYCRL
jgi:hypothetical protein